MKTRTLIAHPEMWPAIDGPMDDDRAWFHQHPGQVVRLRPQFPDELETIEVMDRVAWQSQRPRIAGIAADGSDLPISWMAIVDLLRLAGLPHGPGGESGRARFGCIAPLDAAMASQITAVALATVRASIPAMSRPPAKHRRRDRGSRRGFGQ